MIKNLLFIVLTTLLLQFVSAQEGPPSEELKDTTWKKVYRETPARINDLVHTKLDVRFDYTKSYLIWKSMDHTKASFLSNRFIGTGCKRNGN